MGFGFLSASIWLPIAVGVVLLALGRDDNPVPVRWAALVGAVASLLVTLPQPEQPQHLVGLQQAGGEQRVPAVLLRAQHHLPALAGNRQL